MKNWKDHISIDPEIRFGKPCIRGTRIAILDILAWLSIDQSFEEIIEDFPQISREDILAALTFAANREENIKIMIAAV